MSAPAPVPAPRVTYRLTSIYCGTSILHGVVELSNGTGREPLSFLACGRLARAGGAPYISRGRVTCRRCCTVLNRLHLPHFLPGEVLP